MSQVQFERTSRDSAVGTEVVLRDENDRRLVFRPHVVNSARDSCRPVLGDLVWQRKKKANEWETLNGVNLARLRAGEGVRLELNTDEMFLLFHAAAALYQYHAQTGVPVNGAVVDVSPRDVVGHVIALADAIEKVGVENLDRYLQWMLKAADGARVLEQLDRLDVQDLQQLTALAGVSRLRKALVTWLQNEENADEKWWQAELRANTFVLSQLFSFPVLLVQQEAYVGGQTLARTQGNFLDYLFKNQLTQNVALVEIKTPATDLLGRHYRPDVYGPSSELAGAVQQVTNSRENLLKKFFDLSYSSGHSIEAFSPPALVIIGHTNQLTDATRKKSFELYRHNLRNVQVVTYDEMFAKTNNLIRLLEGQVSQVDKE